MYEFQEKSGIIVEIVKKIEVPRLRYFRGKINHTLPLLLSGTDEDREVIDIPRTPMTLKQLLDERVNSTYRFDRDLLRKGYTDVAFFEIGNPDNSGEIKYALYSQPLAKELFNSLNPRSNIVNRKLFITPDQYHAIPEQDSLVIPADVANDLRKKGYSHPDIRRKIWVYGAEGDESLFDGSLGLVQQLIGGDFSNRMGIFPSSYSGFGSWFVGGSDGYGRSFAGDWDHLDCGGGRLVGVAPKAQAVTETLEQSL